METSKEDTVEDQVQILDVCKENGHFSHGNSLLSEQNEDSSKILIKYHQGSEVSLQILSTSEEILQEVAKDCIESIDSSETHEIAPNMTIGESTAAENQKNPLCPQKSIPIITVSLEEVSSFDMEQELIEIDETPILSTDDHQEQVENTKQTDTTVLELSNLENKSVAVLESIKEETGAEVTPDLETSSNSDHSNVTKEANSTNDQEVLTTTISPTINMDSIPTRSTEFENSKQLPTTVAESKLDNGTLTVFEPTDENKVGKVFNESKVPCQANTERAGNLETNVEKVTPNLDSSPKDEHSNINCIENSTATPLHTHLSTNSKILLKNCSLSEKNDEIRNDFDDETDFLRDKSSDRGDVNNRQENQPRQQQQSPPQILTVGEIDTTTSIQLVEDSGKEERMKEKQVNLRRNLRSAVSLRDESNTSPTPPPRRLSLRRVQTASEYSGLNSPDRQSLVSLPRGRLYFPSNGLPATPEEPTRAVRKEKRTMFSWLGGDSSKKKNKEVLESVSEGLRKIYKQKLYPLEEFYKFNEFHSPFLDDPDFDAKPMILLVGQYSTGKTTFIRYLLEQDFPGIRIGPEPTTDRFIAVMNANEEGVIPGNALVVDAKKQFRALSGFGNAFLNRFQCSTLPNQVLESVTIVDTPGILSGEKQRIDRGYDFTGVLEWFAERVDRIILLFDAHKLDISDEFKRCIEALAGNEDKIRIVLNKSDMVDHQQLMRVYGALMWSLGKVFKTPEVSRVYIGTFWDHPLHHDINRRLFQDEQHDLFADLQALPRNAALRKLNDLIKRARLAKVHAYIINELRKQMPAMLGKDKKKKELIQGLDKIYEQLQREHNISPGDFPDIQKMREKLEKHDFSKFNPLKPKLIEVVDGMLAHDIARLMSQIPKEEAAAINAAANPDKSGPGPAEPAVRGGAFSQAVEAETPFGFGKGEGFDKGADETEWVVNKERTQFDSTFDGLGPVGGYLSGRAAKEHMVKSKLPNSVLGKVWKLADVDKDGQLDSDEFALANYLINLKLEGHELPSDLPKHLVPPSKRSVANGTADQFYPKLEDDDE